MKMKYLLTASALAVGLFLGTQTGHTSASHSSDEFIGTSNGSTSSDSKKRPLSEEEGTENAIPAKRQRLPGEENQEIQKPHFNYFAQSEEFFRDTLFSFLPLKDRFSLAKVNKTFNKMIQDLQVEEWRASLDAKSLFFSRLNRYEKVSLPMRLVLAINVHSVKKTFDYIRRHAREMTAEDYIKTAISYDAIGDDTCSAELWDKVLNDYPEKMSVEKYLKVIHIHRRLKNKNRIRNLESIMIDKCFSEGSEYKDISQIAHYFYYEKRYDDSAKLWEHISDSPEIMKSEDRTTAAYVYIMSNKSFYHQKGAVLWKWILNNDLASMGNLDYVDAAHAYSLIGDYQSAVTMWDIIFNRLKQGEICEDDVDLHSQRYDRAAGDYERVGNISCAEELRARAEELREEESSDEEEV